MKYKVINNYEDVVEKIFDSEEEAYAYIESKHPLLDDKYSVEEVNETTNHKAILISIRPKWVSKILNGEKTLEIRKKFPKDYVGWVYIYCTKDNNNLLHKNCADIWWVEDKDFQKKNKRLEIKQQPIYNGKVVARFWCDSVEELFTDEDGWSYYTDTITKDYEVSKLACIDDSEIEEYLNGKIGYAIHISELEIFDKPKELGEFYTTTLDKNPFKRFMTSYTLNNGLNVKRLTKAPQSWCYVEV